MAALHSWLNTQPDKISQLFVHVLAQRCHFTHIYIPFILSFFTTYKIIMNFGALN